MWLSKTARHTVKTIESVSRVIAMIGMGIMVIMMILTVMDVVGRYFANRPIPGTTELTEYMMVCVVFSAGVWCAIKRRHVKVDLVVSRFTPRIQAIFDSITYFLGLGVCAVITWQSFVESLAVRRLHMISLDLSVPTYPFYWVLVLGCGLLCLVMITQLAENVVKAVKG
jgi:TRAP-type C4-dicarboxylate transport system permease small subunit